MDFEKGRFSSRFSLFCERKNNDCSCFVLNCDESPTIIRDSSVNHFKI